MAKHNNKYTVTVTGYTERIQDDVDDADLDNVVYIYCDRGSFLIPKKDDGLQKVLRQNWDTSKTVNSEWREIHNAIVKVYDHELEGYIVTRDGPIHFSPMDYCYGSFDRSEIIKTDQGRIVLVTFWDCESG